MKKIILTIFILQCNILFAIENEKINFFASVGSINNYKYSSEKRSNSYFYDGLEASLGISYNGNIKYVDNIFIKASYSVVDLLDYNYNSYTLSIIYNLINYNIINIYIGYDILGIYNIRQFYNIGSTYEVAYQKDTKHFANGLIIGGDITIYKGYALYIDYKNSYINNLANIESINIGLKYKFTYLHKNILPNIR